MKAAIYARVSTKDQHCELQLGDMEPRAQREGWEAVVLIEKESTKKRRPVLDQLLKDAVARKYDVVMVWKLDRFGRTFQELVQNIESVDLAGVRFICTTQGIDTDQRNPVSRLTLRILASFAEFERDLREERCSEGFAGYRRAHSAGLVGSVRHSRSKKDLPVGRPKLVLDRQRVIDLVAQGLSRRAIAKTLSLSLGTVQRALAAGA